MTIYDIVFIQDKIKEAIMVYLLLLITLKRKEVQDVILSLIPSLHALTKLTCKRTIQPKRNNYFPKKEEMVALSVSSK